MAGRPLTPSSNSHSSPPSPSAPNCILRPAAFRCATRYELGPSRPVGPGFIWKPACGSVGSGSTRADFELLGYDYDHRFGAMKRGLETMRRAWRGEATNAGGTLSVWPDCEGGPPILMGAWRSPRWITFAAQECQGWTPSGRYSSWDDLEHGMRIYREAERHQRGARQRRRRSADRPESAAPSRRSRRRWSARRTRRAGASAIEQPGSTKYFWSPRRRA